MGPSYVELGWLGQTFPDLVCLEGRGVSGLTGPALHGRVTGPGGSMIRNKEQGNYNYIQRSDYFNLRVI